MEIMLDVIALELLGDFRMLLTFENGERRVFDLEPLLACKPFNRLRDPQLFGRAVIDYGTVVWPGNIDIAPETLYLESRAIAD